MLKSSSLFLLIGLFYLNTINAQNVASTNQIILNWDFVTNLKEPRLNQSGLEFYQFNQVRLPAFTQSFLTNNRSKVEFFDLEYINLEKFQEFKNTYLSKFNDLFQPKILYTYEGANLYTVIKVPVFKKINNQIQYLKSFKYKLIAGEPVVNSFASSKRTSNNSVLSTGKWFKFSVTKDGFYKLSKQQLTQAGINLAGINPKTIKLFGHHGGMLTEYNKLSTYDDIPENAIQIVGEEDGSFDDNDYIIFYAQSPHKWKYEPSLSRFKHELNVYSDQSFFFLTYGGLDGKRITLKSDGNNLTPDITFNWYDYYTFHDEEKENICNEGRIYLGERFDQTTSYSFNENIPNFTNNKELRIFYEAGAVSAAPSELSLSVNGNLLSTMNFASLSNEYDCFTDGGIKLTSTVLNSATNQLTFRYNKPLSGSKAWLNYYELHASRLLNFNGFATFRNSLSNTYNIVEYQMNSLSQNHKVFDITDINNISEQQVVNSGSSAYFRSFSDSKIKEYAYFDGTFLTPDFVEEVPNQNLHNTGIVQYIIISPKEFLDASNKLANFHKSNGMDVLVVTPQAIYNEYSSGSQDVVAIRDFIRHVYYKNNNPVNQLKYVLMMGDASFDYKNKMTGNTNFVPTYESEPKWNIPVAFNRLYFCSDDFFCYLDSTDGDFGSEQKIEVSIGRMPVASAQEAMAMVDKVLHYKSVATLGEWRTNATLCADDMDAGWEEMFLTDFEKMSKGIDSTIKNLNVRKVYFDAFKQQNLSGSQRYPEVQEALKKEFESGTLVFNYVGHGGEQYLASEKVIDIPFINSLKNKDNLPVFFTATCEFSRFDDAKRKSAGEILFTNPNGGAIAMYTTTRLVFAGDNANLTFFFWENCAYVKIGGKWPTLGQIYKKLKNRDNPSDNDRMFAFFGDPAITMNYPENIVKLDSINGKMVGLANDTMKALSKMNFTGHVEDILGNKMTSFNGKVNSTFFDKKSNFLTLGNDNNSSSILPFSLYTNVLFKGENSVQNGGFKISFIVPKDINYNYGTGRISLYADNNSTDAWGSELSVLIGGTNNNAANDVKGPELEMAIDDYSFISGGITNSSPILLAKLNDEHGINTSGNGIGRDIIAIIDIGTPQEKKYNLNAFYKATLNSYQSGEVEFKLEGISPGKHTYTLKAWDVYNNSSEQTIEFVVKSSDEFTIENLLNYPNPFSNKTVFHFDHNQLGENLNIVINIYTITGKVVKSIQHNAFNSKAHISEIEWDGKDEFGDKLSKGVYIYSISVSTENGKKAQKTEKLVILN